MEGERFSLYPIKLHDIYNHYLKARSLEWNESKLISGLRKDVEDTKKMTGPQHDLLDNVVGQFVVLDYFVNKNIHDSVLSICHEPEIMLLMNQQAHMEGIHMIVYSEFVKIYYPMDRQASLFNSAQTDPFIKAKIKWASQKFTFLEEMIVFGLVEGVLFAGAFAGIFYFTSVGLMQGFTKANEYIIQDEGCHVISRALIFKHCLPSSLQGKDRPTQERFEELSNDLLEIDKKHYAFLNLPGLTYTNMIMHIKSKIDQLAELFGYLPFHKVKSPLTYMNKTNIATRSTSFFTSLSTEYIEPNFSPEDLTIDYQ